MSIVPDTRFHIWFIMTIYYKIRQVFYYKMRQFYYQMRHLLQNATFITNRDRTNYESQTYFTASSSKGYSKKKIKSRWSINTVDSRCFKYSVSQTFRYLEKMSWSLGKQWAITVQLKILDTFKACIGAESGPSYFVNPY